MRTEPVERYDYKGLVVEIHHDDDPIDPRKDWDHASKMVCWHSRYDLGDEQPSYSPDEFFLRLAEDIDPTFEWDLGATDEGVLAMKKRAREIVEQNVAVLPLYLYDHSGITMSTGSFSCPWDSGQVGWIYLTLEAAIRQFVVAETKKKKATWNTKLHHFSNRKDPEWSELTLREAALKSLAQEVETYDQYLRGEVYGFRVLRPKKCGSCGHTEEEELDACWGFYGDIEYVKSEAEEAADSHVETCDES